MYSPPRQGHIFCCVIFRRRRLYALTVEQRVARIGHIYACPILKPEDFWHRTAGGFAQDYGHVADLDDSRCRAERYDRKADRRFFRCK